MNRQVRLDNEAHDKLMEPINGQGGLQRLLKNYRVNMINKQKY